jgi:hypothetical protein
MEAVNTSKLIEIVARLRGALQNQINDPATASHQQQVSAELSSLRSTLGSMETNVFPPGWKQVLTERKLWYFIGDDLLGEIDEIFARNTITPTLAMKELAKVDTILQADVKAANDLLAGFGRMEFPVETVEPGHAEFGVLIPRDTIDNELARFSRELNDTAKIIGVFEELTTNERREPKILSLSSSDLTVLLDIWPVSGAALAAAIERIASFYKQTLEIKKLKLEMARLEVPENISQQLDTDANEKMETNLRSLRDEIIKKYKGSDKARKHELNNELLMALHKIANKIDGGIHFEFRAGEPPAADEPEGENEEQKSLRTDTVAINDIGRRLAFIEPVKGRILRLPEGDKGDAPAGGRGKSAE